MDGGPANDLLLQTIQDHIGKLATSYMAVVGEIYNPHHDPSSLLPTPLERLVSHVKTNQIRGCMLNPPSPPDQRILGPARRGGRSPPPRKDSSGKDGAGIQRKKSLGPTSS